MTYCNTISWCTKTLAIFLIATLLLISCKEGADEGPIDSPPQEGAGIAKPIRGKGAAKILITSQNASPGMAYLMGTYTDRLFRQDSAMVGQDGIILFEQQDAYPQGHYYLTTPNQQFFQLLLGEDQTMEIKVDMNQPIHTFHSDNQENELLYSTLRKEEVLQAKFDAAKRKLSEFKEGTPQYEAIRVQQLALNQERREMLQEVFGKHNNSLFVAFKKAGQNPELRVDLPEDQRIVQYRKDFWVDVDFADPRLIRTPVISNKLKRYFTELTPQHPDSIVQSAYWLIDRALPYPEYFQFFANWVPINYEPTKTTLMDPEMVYVSIIQRYHTFERAFWADSTLVIGLQKRAREMAGSLLGLRGPNVTAPDANGQSRSIDAMQEDYIVVYLYSPDCEHCREETPKLIQWHQKSKPYTAGIFGIAVKTTDEDWKQYLQQTKMPWINVFDPTNRAVYGKYFVDITPELYVLNKDRKIIAKNVKTHQLDEVIMKDLQR